MKIVCVYKTGGDFDIEYVERLEKSVRHLGYEFICLSDDPNVPGYVPLNYKWSGWWAKMELFRPDIEGDIFYLDLDTIIEGHISELLDVCRGNPIMLRDFYFPENLASGVMYLPEHCREHVWEEWIVDPCGCASYCGTYGDQKFIRENIEGEIHRWQDYFPHMFCSYKLHIKGSAPNHIKRDHIDLSQVKVVCYHGKPRPKDTGWEGLHTNQ